MKRLLIFVRDNPGCRARDVWLGTALAARWLLELRYKGQVRAHCVEPETFLRYWLTKNGEKRIENE